MKKQINILVAVISVLTVGCGNDPLTQKQILNQQIEQVDQTQLQADFVLIDEYISQNSITDVITEPNGLRYKIEVMGTGPQPKLESTVQVTYNGKLMSNHSVFDQGTAVFPLSNLIIGWKIGLPLLPKGTQAILYVPSEYGYGSTGFPPDIPSNSNLIFEIELVDVIE